jgi:hypothetical protein
LTEHLHIVCLDAPGPPDYGGAIDMFFKIKALARTGKKIILHYFAYNPTRNAKGLENDCVAIYTYHRKSVFQALPLVQPFIIQSRLNSDLIKRLNGDNYPILLEGLHCAGVIQGLNNPDRVIIRMHNEEASYYHHLAQTEKSYIKKQYFKQESKLLRKYQQNMSKQMKLATLSASDMDIFQREYGFRSLAFIPCFIPWYQLSANHGRGNYCLYHGNMLVSENEEAAIWLVQNVFSRSDIPLIIAGKGISDRLAAVAKQYNNVSLLPDPQIEQIDELIKNAQINVLPSMNGTGVKLKLLNALLNGRHCITNFNGIKGSQIEQGLSIVDSVQEWRQEVKKLMSKDFLSGEIKTREPILALYDNKVNAEKLNALW